MWIGRLKFVLVHKKVHKMILEFYINHSSFCLLILPFFDKILCMNVHFDKVVEFIEKKSRFIGYRLSCQNVAEIEKALKELKGEHKKATHICYAYSLKNPFLEKAVDDGEPGGTAGRPILSVIQKKGAVDVCVFVVRYFGGIKLGAGGLVRAYTKTASMALGE